MIVQPTTIGDLFAEPIADCIGLPNEDSWDAFADMAEEEFDRLMQHDSRFRSYIESNTLKIETNGR